MSERKITTCLCDNTMCTVFFDYEPSEQATHDCPGCDSSVTINSVEVEGYEIDLVLRETTLDALKMECFDAVENTEEWEW